MKVEEYIRGIKLVAQHKDGRIYVRKPDGTVVSQPTEAEPEGQVEATDSPVQSASQSVREGESRTRT